MEINFADRMREFDTGIFNILDDKKKELQTKGKKIYNFSIGTPDFTPSKKVMQTVSDACLDPENYKYTLRDIRKLNEAVRNRYQKRYQTEIREEEVMSVYGSQEGMAHLFLSLVNPGDVVLVPDPGYPIFSIGPMLAGAKLETYPLYEENDYLPNLSRIPEEICKKAKVMVVSYPANPVCATAPDEFYEELIAFAEEHQIIIIHDNAYSDIIFDGRKGKSFLSFPGAKEVGAEFYSLSKSYNYTGARMSFLVGNAKIIENFKKLRSQIDYGIFMPVQLGAVSALYEDDETVIKQCREYQKRRDALCGGLRKIGWNIPDSKGTMFAWGKIPQGYSSDMEFVIELMEKTGVICTPGSSFGSLGKGYVRFALVLPVEEIAKAVEAIEKSGILSFTK